MIGTHNYSFIKASKLQSDETSESSCQFSIKTKDKKKNVELFLSIQLTNYRLWKFYKSNNPGL